MADTTNPTISQISINGTTYDIRDATARNDNETMEAHFAKYFNYMHNIKNSGTGVLYKKHFIVPPYWIEDNVFYLNIIGTNVRNNPSYQIDIAFRSNYDNEQGQTNTRSLTIYNIKSNNIEDVTKFGIVYHGRENAPVWPSWGFYSKNGFGVFAYIKLTHYNFPFGDKEGLSPSFEDIKEFIDSNDQNAIKHLQLPSGSWDTSSDPWGKYLSTIYEYPDEV